MASTTIWHGLHLPFENRDFRWRNPMSVYLCAQGDTRGESICAKIFGGSWYEVTNWRSPATREICPSQLQSRGFGNQPIDLHYPQLWSAEAFRIVCAYCVRGRWVYTMWCEEGGGFPGVRWWECWRLQHQSHSPCICISRIDCSDEEIQEIQDCMYKVKWVVNLMRRASEAVDPEFTEQQCPGTRECQTWGAGDWGSNLSTCIMHKLINHYGNLRRRFS